MERQHFFDGEVLEKVLKNAERIRAEGLNAETSWQKINIELFQPDFPFGLEAIHEAIESFQFRVELVIDSSKQVHNDILELIPILEVNFNKIDDDTISGLVDAIQIRLQQAELDLMSKSLGRSISNLNSIMEEISEIIENILKRMS